MTQANFLAPSPADDDTGRLTARTLLDIGAIGVNAAEPFRFTSGWASPVYVDCRRVIAFPRARRFMIERAVRRLARDAGVEAFDAVAGGETAGIPYAAWMAEQLDLPMLYVRKQAKGFGRNAQIEGTFAEGARVLLVEDLASDGASKARFTAALRQAGAQVDHTFVVFFYGIFPQASSVFEHLRLRLHALATWWDVLAVAREEARFDTATLDTVEAFLRDPVGWSAAHGGRASIEEA